MKVNVNVNRYRLPAQAPLCGDATGGTGYPSADQRWRWVPDAVINNATGFG